MTAMKTTSSYSASVSVQVATCRFSKKSGTWIMKSADGVIPEKQFPEDWVNLKDEWQIYVTEATKAMGLKTAAERKAERQAKAEAAKAAKETEKAKKAEERAAKKAERERVKAEKAKAAAAKKAQREAEKAKKAKPVEKPANTTVAVEKLRKSMNGKAQPASAA